MEAKDGVSLYFLSRTRYQSAVRACVGSLKIEIRENIIWQTHFE